MAASSRLPSSGSLSGITVQQNEQNEKNDGRDVPYSDDGAQYSSEKTDEEKAPPAQEGPVAPEGGTTAWLVVLGAWCISFCSFGWINSTRSSLGK
jgi:hypothetical protein